MQAELSLRWAHISEGTFSHVAAKYISFSLYLKCLYSFALLHEQVTPGLCARSGMECLA